MLCCWAGYDSFIASPTTQTEKRMPSAISGRIEERQELLEALNSRRSEFIVTYGRRRIGKTFLIEELFKKEKCYFFHVTGIQKGALKEQLAEFAKAIGKAFYGGASIAAPSSWMKAFEELTNAIKNVEKNRKIVLFFDELPWMCTKKSRLIQALDHYWNHYWKNYPNIKLIVCGSSASWIIRQIIHHKGGLHNRNTRTILLRPFNLSETKLFFNSLGIRLTNQQIVEIYSFCGGIPYYLNYIKRGKSAAQMIDKMCFQENGVLYNEFDKLFDSLFEESNVFKELVEIIARKREGVSRAYIGKKSKLLSRGGTLTERLKNLEDAAFIKSFIPLGHMRRGGYYRVTDEFCYFYLKWIKPAKRTLLSQEADNKYWANKKNASEYHAWMGYTFESICYKHIREIRNALGIKSGSIVGTWRYSPRGLDDAGAQIDLIFERDDQVTTLCEIKFTEKPFAIDKSYAENLREKIRIYKEQTRSKKQIHLVIISANGIKKNKYSDELVDGVVTLEDLF